MSYLYTKRINLSVSQIFLQGSYPYQLVYGMMWTKSFMNNRKSLCFETVYFLYYHQTIQFLQSIKSLPGLVLIHHRFVPPCLFFQLFWQIPDKELIYRKHSIGLSITPVILWPISESMYQVHNDPWLFTNIPQ